MLKELHGLAIEYALRWDTGEGYRYIDERIQTPRYFGFTSNHNGSFPFTECHLIDDAHARVAFMNLVPNGNAWGYSEATITVLYIKQ